MRPVIAIPCDRAADADRYHAIVHYAQQVERAGAVPILLPHCIERIGDYLAMCHGFVLAGGDDPDTTAFGQPVHPRAELMHPERQRFDLALLAALDRTAHPVLGICLGMQLMALHHGGRLCQHLADLSGDIADLHAGGPHTVTWKTVPPGPAPTTADHRPTVTVFSKHHQAVADPGRLRIAATAPDGIIEAIELPDPQRFYLGVQWHPERTEDPSAGLALFKRLIGR